MTNAEISARGRFRVEHGSLLVGIAWDGAKAVQFFPIGELPLDLGYRFRTMTITTNIEVTRDMLIRRMGADRMRMARDQRAATGAAS